ncbi:MAG: hypothetical protein EOP61_28610 [Sphingomonadales bacterium]|nr:MAG: hypothetical protein EOP61_28610 [Sphingomonadales bacterium]
MPRRLLMLGGAAREPPSHPPPCGWSPSPCRGGIVIIPRKEWIGDERRQSRSPHPSCHPVGG